MSLPVQLPGRGHGSIYRGLRIWVLASFIFICAWPATAAEAPLTFAEAQRLAVTHSRQLPAQEASITASREMAVAAGQLPDPILKLGVENLPVEGADRFSTTRESMTMRTVGIMQEFTRAEKRQLRSERFTHEAEKARIEKSAALAAIQRDTALAWLDAHYLQAILHSSQEQLAQARLEIQAAETAYRSGRGNQADIFMARSSLSMLEDRNDELKLRLRSAQLALSRWTGVGASTSGQPPADTLRLDPASLERELAAYPQIAALGKQEDIAQTEARLAQVNRKPDWSLEFGYSQRASRYGNMVSIGVSVPLQWDRGNRQDRELAASRARAEQAAAQRDEASRAYLAEIKTMHAAWQTGLARSRRFQQDLLPQEKNRTQAMLAAYRGGRSSLNEVLAAQRNEFDARLQLLQLQAETARLWAQLNFLLPDESLLDSTRTK